MEQHPIPQNISGFQFKLIGDITLKQFAYVAGGLIAAYLATKITLVPSLLRWPIAGFFALLGFGLAFLPVEERPLDRWLASFIKSIYSPTQYVWKKSNPPPDILMSTTSPSTPTPSPTPTPPPPRIPAKTAQEFLSSVPPTVKQPSIAPPPPPLFRTVPIPPLVSPATPTPPSPPPIKEDRRWQQGAPPPPKLTVQKPPVPPPADNRQVVYQEKKESVTTDKRADSQKIAKLTTQFQQKTASLADRITELQKELAAGTIAKERLFELQQLLGQLLTEKERMSNEVVRLRRELQEKDMASIERPDMYSKVDPLQKTTVRVVASPKALIKEGIPKLTTTPNVITGIIKDSNGNLLPNLIVTVKDREGVPVRALKTNKLGQFAASTSLANGVYIIEVEDPKQTFQFKRIEMVLTGLVLPAIGVSAVSEKDLLRQKLAHEIFGKNTL